MTDVATKERAPAKEKAADMKLTVDRADLLRALTHAVAIVDRMETIPVLANVLIEAAGDILRVTATDLDLQIALAVKANIEAGGSTTVSASILHGIVREMADGAQIELTLQDKRLQVRSGRSDYKLQTVSADDFPVMKLGSAKSTFLLPATDLLRSLRRVEFAQSFETVTRPYLCGVVVETVDGKVVFAATDGNALAFASLDAPAGADVTNAILPTKLVTTLGKLLDGRDEEVRVFFEDRKVIFEFPDAVLTSKLIEGTYPDWRRVVPRDDGRILRIGADTLETAIRRATIVASERTRAVKFELSKDKLVASCSSLEHGSAVEEAPCAWDSGEFQIGFNSRLLLDAIKASGAEDLQFGLIDAAAPTLITNPADDSAKWIVMPMRI